MKEIEKKSWGKPTVKEYRPFAFRMPAKSVCETDGCQPNLLRAETMPRRVSCILKRKYAS